MVHKLIVKIIDELRSGLNGIISDINDHIVLGPPSITPRPLVAVYEGDLRVDDKATDFSFSQPRPMGINEEFPMMAGTPHGPYPLTKTPLKGSAQCRLVYDKNGLNEQRRLILENKDFSIDYVETSLLIKTETDISDVSHIQLYYSFPGIFFLQDFQQEFFIELLGPDSAILEQLSSLATSIVFTNHDELVNYYNNTDRTVYSSTQYLSEHSIGRVAWLDSSTEYTDSDIMRKMRFLVNGQIKHVRNDVSGFGLIEKIHSPAATSEAGVNIDPELV